MGISPRLATNIFFTGMMELLARNRVWTELRAWVCSLFSAVEEDIASDALEA